MKLVPAFIGVMNRQPRIAGVLFVLLLTGNTLRVICESMAYLYGGAFYIVMGLSGFIEVSALALYGVTLWRAMGMPSYGANSINGKRFERMPLRPGPVQGAVEVVVGSGPEDVGERT
jgi:hypothetical protein